jgi:hypothetical protein
MHTCHYKKLLHGPKKAKREGKNGQELIEMYLLLL